MSLEQSKPRREPGTDQQSDQDYHRPTRTFGSTPDADQEPTSEPTTNPVAIDTHREDAILAIMFGGLAVGFSGISLLLWTAPLAVGLPPEALSLATLSRVVGAAVALLLGVGFGALSVVGGVVYVFSESTSGDTA